MEYSKWLLMLAVLLASISLAYRLGYRAKSPRRFGGVIGTFLVCALYGLLALVAWWVIYIAIGSTGFWKSHENDLWFVVILLFMSPVYWIGILLGMWKSGRE